MNQSLKQKAKGVLIVAVVSSAVAYQSFAQTTDPWSYFPNNGVANFDDDSLNLALTAPQGTAVSMSYTPATYQIKTLPGKPYVELQIENVSLIPGVDTIKTPGHSMDIIFDPKGKNRAWKVTCINSSNGEENKILEKDYTSNRLHISENQCSFNNSWSDTLRIYPGEGNDSMVIKTVWEKDKDGDGDPQGLSEINGLGLINVFKFRTQNGTVNLLNTETSKIRNQDNQLIGPAFRTISEKIEYENSLNWTVIYNTGTSAKFEFLVDVSGKNELILFEKDADAGHRYEPTVPPDTGVKFQVLWNDNKSDSYVEGWTNIDQYNDRDHTVAKPGETNSYVGPSGDTIKDPDGIDSIHWYSIDVSEQKTSKVKIIWSGFAVGNNGIGLAADAVVQASCEAGKNCPEDLLPPEDEEDEETPEDEENICPENDDPECTEITEDGNLKLQTTIGSTPPPETNRLKEKGIIKITYHLTIKNLGEETIEDLELDFSAPEFTLIESTPLLDHKTFDYGDLPADSTINQDLTVIIDGDAPDEGTISTAGRLILTSSNLSDHRPKIIRHYLGDKPIDPNDPSIPKCSESGNLRACIISTPLPDPSPESFGLDAEDPEKNSITYHLTIENISDTVTLQQVNIGFEPPAFTSLDPAQIATIIPLEGSGSYTGKGPGRFDLAASLAPQTSIGKDITVVLDNDTPSKNFDISSDGLISAGAQNNPAVTLPALLHHAGLGAVNIQVSRCYAYDYFGGEFTCDLSCRTVEPGSSITVRDLVTNIGGETAFDQTYFPPPLSSHFEYEPNSIRIDDPIAGLTAPNDGDSFPPAGGITIPGPLEPNQGRAVYFKYFIPPDILDEETPPGEESEEDSSCYPEEDEEVELPEGQTTTTPIEYEADCPEEEGSEAGAENGRICVKVEPNPILELTLTAVPSPTNTVFQGSIITYFLTIKNTTKQPVTSLVVEGSIPAQTTCKSGNCTGLISTDPPELADNFGTITYSFSVQVMDNTAGTSIVHPGITVKYSGGDGGEQTKKSNAITHPLLAAPEPTGDFQHDITVNRKTVLNSKDGNARGDQGDKSTLSYEFSYAGDPQRIPVLPYLVNGTLPEQNNKVYFCAGYVHTYDAPWNTQMITYNASLTLPNELTSYRSITQDNITFTVTTDLPSSRPELINNGPRLPNTHQDIFTYTVPTSIVRDGISAVNYFMKNGGEIEQGILKSQELVLNPQAIFTTDIRAVADGQPSPENSKGVITSKNVGKIGTTQRTITKDVWSYRYTGKTIKRITCSCGRGGCSYQNVPEYNWFKSAPQSIDVFSAEDKDYITVLTSVAWLQTKYGNLGFGTNFWQTIPETGDPNLVNLGDINIPTTMKFYTPPNEYNADLFIYSSDGGDPLLSRLGNSGKITFGSLEQGFITSPTEESSRQLSRGEAYDRENYPREYYDDLLNREVFGEVIRLNSGGTLPPGMSRNGDEFYIGSSVNFTADTIYHLKGNLTIGSGAISEVTINGGKARLFVEGNVTILSNTAYAKKSDPDLSKIPSLRVHATGNITINPIVTDLELMILAEKEFHSGRGDKQLRILGDVIAYKTFWERAPLNEERENEEMINKPSEIIYEDLRKYLLTPPGDKKLPDTGHMWREVNPSTGRPILESLLSE